MCHNGFWSIGDPPHRTVKYIIISKKLSNENELKRYNKIFVFIIKYLPHSIKLFVEMILTVLKKID